MARRLTVMALLAAAGLASCDRGGAPADTPAAGAGSARAEAPVSKAEVEGTISPPSPPEAALPAGEAIEGAPVFAVVYPGGVVETTPLTPVAAGGAGGGIVFTSDASPDDIVAFYRRKAEAAGLASVMSMNQGETRGYGAAGAPGGAGLQVVAHPVEPGQTSVQLTWTPGQ